MELAFLIALHARAQTANGHALGRIATHCVRSERLCAADASGRQAACAWLDRPAARRKARQTADLYPFFAVSNGRHGCSDEAF